MAHHPPAVSTPLFRTTFFWPLTLDLPSCTDKDFSHTDPGDLNIGKLVEDQIALLLDGGHWQHQPDGLRHLPCPPADEKRSYEAAAYGEYVYFHDFVQHYLYNRQSLTITREGDKFAFFTTVTEGEPTQKKGATFPVEPFYLFQRHDIARVRFKLGEEHWETKIITPTVHELMVERINLYVLRAGVAMLAVEVSNVPGQPVALHDAMKINDRLRRSHAPFLKTDRAADRAPVNLVPLELTWLGRDSLPVSPIFNINDDAAQAAANLWKSGDNAREAKPFQHWQWLLNPQTSAAGTSSEADTRGWTIAPSRADGITWRHVADERLPILTTLGLASETDYRSLSEGDWMRLCFVDGPGSDAYPFARKFLEAQWPAHTYDRYHSAPCESSDAPVRYLLSSYALTAVGCGSFFPEYIANHMRRHYFQLMLVAQIELAAMLSFSSRISGAVADFEDEPAREDAEERLSARLNIIERDMLQYVHRFRFTGVSGQLQPQEMFAQLRQVMRLDAIYADLKDELTMATQFLAMRATQDQAKEEARQAKAQERLSVIATIGVVFGLAFGFLSMNVLASSDFLESMGLVPKQKGLLQHVAAAAAVMALFTAGAFLLTFMQPGGETKAGQPRSARMSDPVTLWLRQKLGWGAALLLAAAIGAYAIGRHNLPEFGVPAETQSCTADKDGFAECPVKKGAKP
jgi:hypothetical protein